MIDVFDGNGAPSGPNYTLFSGVDRLWWRRQFRELKKLIFSAPGTCPIALSGPVANGAILKRLQVAQLVKLVCLSRSPAFAAAAADAAAIANCASPGAFSESSRHRGSETTPFEQRIDACAFVFRVVSQTGADDAAVATNIIRHTAACKQRSKH